MSFFNVSNATTFSMLFGSELQSASGQVSLKGDVCETVMRFVAA